MPGDGIAPRPVRMGLAAAGAGLGAAEERGEAAETLQAAAALLVGAGGSSIDVAELVQFVTARGGYAAMEREADWAEAGARAVRAGPGNARPMPSTLRFVYEVFGLPAELRRLPARWRRSAAAFRAAAAAAAAADGEEGMLSGEDGEDCGPPPRAAKRPRTLAALRLVSRSWRGAVDAAPPSVYALACFRGARIPREGAPFLLAALRRGAEGGSAEACHGLAFATFMGWAGAEANRPLAVGLAMRAATLGHPDAAEAAAHMVLFVDRQPAPAPAPVPPAL
eukprot:tig00000789_g4111.t1